MAKLQLAQRPVAAAPNLVRPLERIASKDLRPKKQLCLSVTTKPNKREKKKASLFISKNTNNKESSRTCNSWSLTPDGDERAGGQDIFV